jgi:predicted aspartyl protease
MPVQQPYERVKYYPSAPVLDITVRSSPALNQPGGETIRVLVDSGADATMLPETLLVNIGAQRIDRRRSRGIYGQVRTVSLYLVDVQIGLLVIPSIQAIGIAADDEPLLGRDVLNHLIVTLDGIGGVTEIS